MDRKLKKYFFSGIFYLSVYNFVFKKPYFFKFLTLVTWKMLPIFLTLFPYQISENKGIRFEWCGGFILLLRLKNKIRFLKKV